MTATKGWTHPQHWKVAAVALVMQICSVIFFGAGLMVPLFTDRRSNPALLLHANEMNIVCRKMYCYKAMKKDMVSMGDWINVARLLVAIGGIASAISLVLQLFVFWPVVLFMKKVFNVVLLVCRIVDFLGAPTKFIGVFIIIWHIPDVNYSHSWYKYNGALQVDPLPLGLILFSYILQTLSFVAATIATDKGAKGCDTHLEVIRKQNLEKSLEAAEIEEFARVSYHHPIDNPRSSKILSEVSHRFSVASSRQSESKV